MVASTNLLKRVAGDSLVLLLLRVISVPLGYITGIAIARFFGAGVMGTYFIALSLVGILTPFCNLGLNIGVVRFVSGIKADRKAGNLKQILRSSLCLVTVLGSLAALFLLVGSSFLGERFKSPALPKMLWFVALSLPISLAYRIIGEAVRALGGVKWFASQEDLWSPLIFLILLVVLGHSSWISLAPVTALGLSYFVKILVALCLMVGCLFLMTRYDNFSVGQSRFNDLLRYSWTIFLASFFGMGLSYLDSIALGLFTNPEQVAYYGVANRIGALSSFPLMAVDAVVIPLFGRFYQMGDLLSIEMVAQSTARWMYYAALPMAVLCILLAPQLLSLYGPEFVKARIALCIFSIGQLINVATGTVLSILVMAERQRAVIRAQFIAGFCSFPLIFLLAATYGLNGVALGYSLALSSYNILMALAVWKELGIKAYSMKIKWANFGALLGICIFFLGNPYVGPWGAAFLFTLIYLALVGKSLKQELSAILSQPQ